MVAYFCFWMSVAVIEQFMTFSAVSSVAFDCSDAKTLIGITKVGSTARA
jgi:hypothetical protein